MAPLSDNCNTQVHIAGSESSTPIYVAAEKGFTEIIKILAPFSNNPNAPESYGNTPIHEAAENGYLEIVKFLASLTDHPNAQNNLGWTPIHAAAENGHKEVVRRTWKDTNLFCSTERIY